MDTHPPSPNPPAWPVNMAAWIRRARLTKIKLPQAALSAMVLVLQEQGYDARLMRRNVYYSSKGIPMSAKMIWAISLGPEDHMLTMDLQSSWKQVEQDFRQKMFAGKKGNFLFQDLKVSPVNEIGPFLGSMAHGANHLARARTAYLDLQAIAVADSSPKIKPGAGATRPRL